MIKVQELKNTDGNPNSYKVSAFADTKEEVDAGGTFEGLPEGADIEMGSTMLTANGEVAFMNSQGEWTWVSEGGGGGGSTGNGIEVVNDPENIPEACEENEGKVILYGGPNMDQFYSGTMYICSELGPDSDYAWLGTTPNLAWSISNLPEPTYENSVFLEDTMYWVYDFDSHTVSPYLMLWVESEAEYQWVNVSSNSMPVVTEWHTVGRYNNPDFSVIECTYEGTLELSAGHDSWSVTMDTPSDVTCHAGWIVDGYISDGTNFVPFNAPLEGTVVAEAEIVLNHDEPVFCIKVNNSDFYTGHFMVMVRASVQKGGA